MTKYWRVLALLAAMALVLAACGGDDDTDDTEAGDTTTTTAAEETTTTEGMEEETTTTEGEETTTTEAADGGDDGPFIPTGLPTIDPLNADPANTIGIAGSSTVFPLSTAIMTRWEDEGGPNYPIDSIGSGGGLERFCVEGASDISNASRQINDEEIASCQETWGEDPIEVRVGSDALTLVVNPNAPDEFKDLTIEQIATAFSLTDAGATWADVDPAFPAHPIATFTPGEDSGTFDYFNEVIFDEAEPSPIIGSIAQVVGEDDNITVNGVAGDGCAAGDESTTCAIGYFGFAFFAENQGSLAAVSVDGVAPNEDTVADGSYPIARPLFMYTTDSVLDEKPWVANWMAYYLQVVNEEIGEVGYFPAPNDALQEAADNIAPFVEG